MDMILKNTFQSISPAYELIGDVTVGSNTTQVDFTGLNIGKDDELLLVSEYLNGSVGASIALYVNDNITATNYCIQRIEASSTSVSGVRANASIITNTNALNSRHTAFSKIKLANIGYVVWQSGITMSSGSSNVALYDVGGTSQFTASSITKVSLVNQTTNNILSGSRFQLYKLVAEKVADIIVPSNTTSVDITGLDIGKGNEYYLVSTTPTSAVNPNFMLFVNDNNTATNYYTQRIMADSTTITGTRVNNARFSFSQSPETAFAMTNIKLTNSGYYVFKSNSMSNIGKSVLFMQKIVGTSTSTHSSITKFTIMTDLSNGIGANSRFTLYKMK